VRALALYGLRYHRAMKVRFFEDSVRVRLSQREVMDLGAGRELRSVTHFSAGELEVVLSPVADGLTARFENGRLLIGVSAARSAEWSLNELEGLYAMSGPCKVAIEKDYACLHKDGDDNRGTFPNPAALSK
jgi:hypothetical protein